MTRNAASQLANFIKTESEPNVDPHSDDELIRRGEAGQGCGAGPDRRLASQMRFLKRQLSLPVSTMSQWWVSRSSSAVVIFASPKTDGHSPNARLVVTITEVCS